MNVLTRSYDASRTGSNREEMILTPKKVGSNLLLKSRSLHVKDDDPRLEAQPLYVSPDPDERSQRPRCGLRLHDGEQRVAFDANTGQPIWQQPTNLGRPIKPEPKSGPRPTTTDIDMWGVNILWGILSTPVIDLETKKLYAVAWRSPDGKVANRVHELHEVDITNGTKSDKLPIAASAPDQVPSGQKAPTFFAPKQKQRACAVPKLDVGPLSRGFAGRFRLLAGTR